jgi:hypothetical protein
MKLRSGRRELAARDRLGREAELDRGGFTAADRNLLRLGDGAAIDYDFRRHVVDVGRAELQRWGDQRAAGGRRGRRIAVNEETSVGREADDDGRRAFGRGFLGILHRFALGHIFLDRNRGAAGAASAAGAADAARAGNDNRAAARAAAGATIAMEQTAAAAAAAAAATDRATANTATLATMTAMEQATARAAATMTAGAANVRTTASVAGAGAAVATIAAEIDRVIASRQGQNQNCRIHSKTSSNKGKPTHASIGTPKAWSHCDMS